MAASWTLTSCVACSSPPMAVALPDGSKCTGALKVLLLPPMLQVRDLDGTL